ncbi:13924_t:CDS:2, partial [Gigaspora margarita]
EHACKILKTESLNLYPAPTPLPSSPKQSIIHSTLNYSIFEKNGTCFATFSKLFSAQTFSDLANKANNFYKLKDSAEPNIKWNTFYFYSYFNKYLKA